MRTRAMALMTAVTVTAALTACGASDGGGDVVLELPDVAAGDIVSLRADGSALEWIDRRGGRILRLNAVQGAQRAFEPAEVETVATIEVGSEGEQRGLLGTALIGGRRYAAWTLPETYELVVGEIVDGKATRIVWNAGATASDAVGGHLEVYDGKLLLGLGQLTDFARVRNEAGAIPEPAGALVVLDPSGPPTQQPTVLTEQYVNPFAFTVTQDEQVWVADNAVGDDTERIGRGDLYDRSEHPPTGGDPRAPATMVELRDGRIGICGFLDGKMQIYTRPDETKTAKVDTSTGAIHRSPTLTRTSNVGPCQTGAAVFRDGSVVTVTAGTFTRLHTT